ncbi:MAG: 1-acyl-sn-glycerol-3-phosphate acyltransferase [Burkholderiales bacterium]|nr:1-acyl-sn-glycerol-3-phosphate acyltransferase [Burkholderiales bacterium]
MLSRLRFGWRVLRLALKMLGALWISIHTYSRGDQVRRHAVTRAWSRELLHLAGIEVRAVGFPADTERPVTLVANHISWADIFALNTQRACHFIAKEELRRWPVVGRILANVGTIFINRSDRKDTHRLKEVVLRLMMQGETVAVFPEGTTSDGRDVLKFHASLLEPVVAAGGEVWVVAVRYFCPAPSREVHAERRTQAAAYIGDTTMLQSLHAIFAAEPVIAEVRFLEAIDCAGRTRRDVAQRAEAAIRAVVCEP